MANPTAPINLSAVDKICGQACSFPLNARHLHLVDRSQFPCAAGRLEVRTTNDGTADAAMVRMQQENVHLRTTAERTAAELRHLRDSRRVEPDSAPLGSFDFCACVPRWQFTRRREHQTN